MSDFGLVDAIESGITKVPRIPTESNEASPKPQFFALWEHVTKDLSDAQKLPSGKPKPNVVWKRAQPALTTLMSQWKERFDYFQEARQDDGKEHVPPVLIIVCDNTQIAELFYRKISGERAEEDANGDTQVTYGRSESGFQAFANTPGERYTVRIDSKMLEEAESRADASESRADAAERLRRVVNTVGEEDRPGASVRCVISVQMLTEGWDANNVTHILGLRAFGSQLLCEQVAGRGLRRIDYTPDPETGHLTEEYVDIYGVPFSVIPFRGREPEKKEPVDRPKQHVRALEERAGYEIRFPVVEGYAFALRHGQIRADIDDTERLVVDPSETPDAVFVKPQVGYDRHSPSLAGNFEFEEQNREQYYAEQHAQTITFEIARIVTHALTGVLDVQSKPELAKSGKGGLTKHAARHKLFPQVFQLVDEYVERKVCYRDDVHFCELGLETYVDQVVSRLLDAIEPDEDAGEPPLLPILNRYEPTGSTAQVNFKTTKPCFDTRHSHVNQAVADTQRWEQSAAFQMERAAKDGLIQSYVKNDHLGLSIPYDHEDVGRSYRPDFLVRFPNNGTLVLEIKGQTTAKDRTKHQSASRWVSAVNNWGKLGRWAFEVCYDPQALRSLLETAFRPVQQ